MYQAAAALSANARWQEVISENLSASSVPGFKRTEMSFAAFESGLMPQDAAKGQKYIMPRAATSTVFAQGPMQPSDVKTHAAIDGKGFFEVQLPSGESVYTRDGSFSLNSNGQLVTKEGYAVLGDGGSFQFDRNTPGEISIAKDGTVSKGADSRGRLKVVDVGDPSLLTPAGGGFWKASSAGMKIVDVPNPSVRGGMLEMANTSAVGEMVSMINAMRLFEANQKVIHAQDERMGKTITELGGPNS
jgi:flagellar basal-body rod protein FlgG